MVAVEASLVLKEIATGERMTPGQNEAESPLCCGALRLLREGLSIADAALAAGFSDQPHLTREFGRTLGMTPGQYVAIRQR